MAIRMMRKSVITWNTRPDAGTLHFSDKPELPNFSNEDKPIRVQEAWDTLARCSNQITLRCQKSTNLEMKLFAV